MKTFNLLSIILGSLTTIGSSWLIENLYLFICAADSHVSEQTILNDCSLDLPGLFYVVNIFSTACLCFLGGTVPVLIGTGELKLAITIGGVCTVYALLNVMMVSFPLWYEITYLLTFCPFCCFGTLIIKANIFNEKANQKILNQGF